MNTPVAALNPDSLLISPLDARLDGVQPVNLARLFAMGAHRNQVRKYTEEPYVNHPIDVANRLNHSYNFYFKVNAPTDMVVAALLHDVVEDCGVKYADLLTFGERVVTYVWWLTDEIDLSHGNRDLRKMLARQKLAAAPVEVRVLKHFDNASNTASIRVHDPVHYEKTYQPEIRLLSEAMGTDTFSSIRTRLHEVYRRDERFL